MNLDIIKGNWKQLKGKVKQQWGKLTDDEVATMKGTHEELTGILQEKYGYKKDKASSEIDSWLEKHGLKRDQDEE